MNEEHENRRKPGDHQERTYNLEGKNDLAQEDHVDGEDRIEARLQAYLDGRLPRDERQAFEAELLAAPDRLEDAYDELAVREVLDEMAARAVRVEESPARPVPAPRTHLRFRPRRVLATGVLTAAACLFVVVLTRSPDTVSPRYRGEGDAAPAAVTPVGDMRGPVDRFLWRRDPRALRYRLEVFDERGKRLFVSTTADTFLVVGDSLSLPSAGNWRATSLDSLGLGIRGTGPVPYTIR